MDWSLINVYAVFAATLSAFAVGWLWYGPLFGKIWMRESGMTQEDLEGANMGKIFGLAFLFELIMAFNLAMFFFGSPESYEMITAANATLYGFLTGFGWVAMALAVNSLYERKSWKYMLVNGGYWTVTFTLMGLILGAWK